MQLYISQIIDNDEISEIVKKYHIGVELIDFSIATKLDNSQQTLNEVNQLDFRNDLAVHGPFFDLIPASFDKKIKAVTLERFNQAYELACTINAKHIVFHTGFLNAIYSYEAWLPNSIAFWQEFMQDKTEIAVYLENVFEDNYDYLLSLVETINLPNFNICLDLGHINVHNKGKFEAVISKLHKYIKHIHLHNNNGIHDQHQSLLKGTIDYKEVFSLLKKHQVDCTFTLEISPLEGLIDSLDWLETNTELVHRR